MNLSTIKSKKKPGFTLVELVIVVTILGILSGLGFMKFDKVQAKARENADYVAAANLATATDLLKNEKPELIKLKEDTTISLEQLKDNFYIKQIPKPQSIDGVFSITIDTNENVIVKVGNEQFYPKIEENK